MHFKPFFAALLILASIGNGSLQAQQDPTVSAIIKEANENSQLKRMSHELMDGVGPRLVGSSKMVQASDWAISQYQQYGIPARRENYGTWRGWDLSLIHI